MFAGLGVSAVNAVTVTVGVTEQRFGTGIAYQDGNCLTEASLEVSNDNFAGHGEASSWARFDLSEIPQGATIQQVVLNYYVYDGNGIGPIADFNGIESDPLDATCSERFTDITNGPVYLDNVLLPAVVGWYAADLGAVGAQGLEDRIDDGWFAVGIDHVDRDNDWVLIRDHDQPNEPFLRVTYEEPQVSEILSVGATPASPTSGVVGQSLNVAVTVGAEVFEPSALRVSFLEGGSEVDAECQEVSASGSYLFDLTLLETAPGGVDYTLRAHLQPGGSCPIVSSGIDDDVVTAAYHVDWALPPDPMREQYGDPVRSWGIEVFGESYSVLGLAKTESPTDAEIVLLPFHGEPDDPKLADLVTTPELGNLILQAWAFDRFVALASLQGVIDNELIPLRDHYDLDTWWSETIPGARLVSKRKVDRVLLGNFAFWASGEVLKVLVTDGASLLAVIGPDLLDLYDLGRLDPLEPDEIQALVFAQSLYSGELESFRRMQFLSSLPELETLFLMREVSTITEDFLDVEMAFARLEAAVEVADHVEAEAASLQLEAELKDLRYEFGVQLADAFVFTPLGVPVLEEEAEIFAWLHDSHSEAIHIVAGDLAETAEEILDLRTDAPDTPENRARLSEALYRYPFRYTHALLPLHAELFAVQYAHLGRVDANVAEPIKWWVGLRDDTLPGLAADYDTLVSDPASGLFAFRDRYAQYLRNALVAEANYAGALRNLVEQDSDRFLRVGVDRDALVGCCPEGGQTTPVTLRVINDYAAPIDTLTVLPGSVAGAGGQSVTFAGVTVEDLAADAETSLAIDVTVPEEWFTFNDEVDRVELSLPFQWTVGGASYSREILVPVVIQPQASFTSVLADKPLYRPGEVAQVTLEWTPLAVPGDLVAVAFWMRPDGGLEAFSWAQESDHSAVVQFLVPEGPYGAYGAKFLVKILGEQVVIPTRRSNKIFYTVPPVVGDLAVFDPSTAALVYPAADLEAALDLADGLGLPTTALYEVEAHTVAELEALASSRNTVLVGGPGANPLVASLVTAGELPDSLQQEGDALLQVLPDTFGGFPSVVVAGFLLRDTQIAAMGLLDAMVIQPCYPLALTHVGNGSDPTADPANSDGCTEGHYVAGQELTLSGAVPDPGWRIDGWTGTDADGSTTSINVVTMPGASHTVSVSYVLDCVGDPATGDTDGDGVCDDLDQCLGDDASGDSDADGFCDTADSCPLQANPGQEDGDGDGIGDLCDNCPAEANASQVDTDADGQGDVCDPCQGAPTLLDPDSAGENGQTRLENFDTLLDDLHAQDSTQSVPVDGLTAQLPPWFTSSTACGTGDLQKGTGTIDPPLDNPSLSHFLVVSDELSELAVAVSMGNDNERMMEIHRAVQAMESQDYPGLPCWIAEYDDGSLTCRSEDTATDATARLGLAYYQAAANPRFPAGARQLYQAAGDALAYRHVDAEYAHACHTSAVTGSSICNFVGGGANTAAAGLDGLVMWIGYFQDISRFLLAAYTSTDDPLFKDRAEEVVDQFLMASEFDGENLTFGRFNFQWDTSVDPIQPKPGNPFWWDEGRAWDAADAPRALWMADTLRIYDLVTGGADLPPAYQNLSDWVQLVLASGTQAAEESCIQYNQDGSVVAGNCGPDYYYNGLGAGLVTYHQTEWLETKLDRALSQYGWGAGRTWNSAPCFGIYRGIRPVKALGTALGLDMPAFVSPTGDADADGVCDGVDQCLGDDAAGDLDSDGICNDLDLCEGADATGDADVDGFCASQDCNDGDGTVRQASVTLAGEAIQELREVTACSEITVGPGLEIGSGGRLVLRAGSRVIFQDFSALAGAALEVRIQPELIPE